MLSASESAQILGISPARVRKLIADNELPANKVGRNWLLREEDVMQRLSSHPKAGRPRRAQQAKTTSEVSPEKPVDRSEGKSTSPHDLYLSCKTAFRTLPAPALMSCAQSPEEAAFYVAVTDFFLQQKQLELVRRGVF